MQWVSFNEGNLKCFIVFKPTSNEVKSWATRATIIADNYIWSMKLYQLLTNDLE